MQPGHAETLLASLPKGDTHMKLGLLAAAVAPAGLGWVLAAVLAILAVASAVISVAIVIGAALDD